MYRKPMLLAAILFAALLPLTGCPGDDPGSKSAEAARIEKEVAKRVAQKSIEMDIEIRKSRMHTFRLLGLIALVGGAVGGLVWLQRYRGFNPAQPRERNLQMPRWWDHYMTPSNRVLELPPPAASAPPAPPVPQAARIETNDTPSRHRARRHRHRNPNHRDQDHDETPRHR